MKRNDYNVKVIDKMCRIVETIKQEKQPLGVNEISRLSGVNVASTFRILYTLIQNDWIYQTENDKYVIGYKLLLPGYADNINTLLKEAAYPIMRKLSDEQNEVVNLVVRYNDKALLLQQTRSLKFAEYVIQMDKLAPLHATSFGKVLLSELPCETLNKIVHAIDYTRYTENTIDSPEKMLETVEVTRKKGYATDIGESLKNTNCIGVPVRDYKGDIIAALSMSGIVEELTVEKQLYYKSILDNASKEITKQINRSAIVPKKELL